MGFFVTFRIFKSTFTDNLTAVSHMLGDREPPGLPHAAVGAQNGTTALENSWVVFYKGEDTPTSYGAALVPGAR